MHIHWALSLHKFKLSIRTSSNNICSKPYSQSFSRISHSRVIIPKRVYIRVKFLGDRIWIHKKTSCGILWHYFVRLNFNESVFAKDIDKETIVFHWSYLDDSVCAYYWGRVFNHWNCKKTRCQAACCWCSPTCSCWCSF